MSTRSTYRVIEAGVWEEKPWKNPLVLMYIHCDGYPSGHPLDTAKWLASGKVINGIGINDHEGLNFNGASCLAAQLVAKYKSGIGGAYLYKMNHRGHSGENYTYDIIVNSETKEITFVAYKVTGGWNGKPIRFKKLFSGKPEDFVKWVENGQK